MKKLILILITYSTILNAQYQTKAEKRQETKEVVPSLCIAVSGFAINETIMRSYAFNEYSIEKKNQTTLTIYATTAITSIATHYIIKAISTKKKYKKRRIFAKW